VSQSPQPSSEKRGAPRRQMDLPVVVVAAENRVEGQIIFDTRDVSVGGAFLRSDLLFEVGDELQVEFQIPSGATIRALARVVHVIRDPMPDSAPGMGVALTNLSERDREAVRTLLGG
jgi:hypothetical protein